MKNKPQNGFTLLETMITMSVFLVILFGVYSMISHFGDVTKNQQVRQNLNQETRLMIDMFASEVKEAGAVMTLAEAIIQTGSEASFNGIWPLNMGETDLFPDGIIIAAGDPDAMTTSTEALPPGGTTLKVADAKVKGVDPLRPWDVRPWSKDDRGIIIGSDGYFVFKVESVDEDNKMLILRDAAVYYSGLLDTSASYLGGQRYTDSNLVKGNAITYPTGSLVVRLTNFSIFAFRDVRHPIKEYPVRQFVRISDTKGEADALSIDVDVESSIITENVKDFQIEYVAYTDFSKVDRNTAPDINHFYFSDSKKSNSSVDNLVDDIRKRRLKEVRVHFVMQSDELTSERDETQRIPALGDQPAYNLQGEKFTYHVYQVFIEPRNYNIVLKNN